MVRYAIQDINQIHARDVPYRGRPHHSREAAESRHQLDDGHLAAPCSTNSAPATGGQIHRQRGQNSGNPIAAKARRSVCTEGRAENSAGFVEGIGLGNTTIAFLTLIEQQPWFLTTNTFQWYDGITWSRGKHNYQAGADIRRHRADAYLGTRQNNSYTFSGQFSGDGFSDFLLEHRVVPSRSRWRRMRPRPLPPHNDGLLRHGRLEGHAEADRQCRSAV